SDHRGTPGPSRRAGRARPAQTGCFAALAGAARGAARGDRVSVWGGAQLGQGERLVKVGSTQPVEELQRIAAHRVAGREDDALRDAWILAHELHVHVAPGEVR